MAIRTTNIVSLGNGTPVVFLHSALSSKFQWFRLMHKIHNDFLSIAPDFYGYGGSPMPVALNRHTLSIEIDFISSLVNNVIGNHTPFHLVGHSYGGAVALRWCLREPGRILSVCVYEPVAFHLLPKIGTSWQNVLNVVENVGNLLYKEKKDEAAEYFVDYWNGSGTYCSLSEEARIYFNRTIKKLPLDSYAIMNEPVLPAHFSANNIPMYLMAGRSSPWEAREIVEIMNKSAPNSQLRWLDANHMAPVSNSEKVNQLIESFLHNQC